MLAYFTFKINDKIIKKIVECMKEYFFYVFSKSLGNNNMKVLILIWNLNKCLLWAI